MKRKLVAMLCGVMALSLVACGGNQNGTESGGTNTQNESSKDEVEVKKEKPARKSVKQIMYQYATGEKESEVETHYDKNGRETYVKHTSYNAGNDQNEPLVTEIKYNWVEEGNIATAEAEGTTIKITYDDDKNVIERYEGNDITNSVQTNTYKDGVLATQKVVGSMSGTELYVMEYTFDDHGNVTGYTVNYTASGTVASIEQSYVYGEDGEILSYTSKTKTGDTEPAETTYKYIYDENGFIDKVEVNGVMVQDYTCDENGNIIHAKLYSGDKLTNENLYEYYEN